MFLGVLVTCSHLACVGNAAQFPTLEACESKNEEVVTDFMIDNPDKVVYSYCFEPIPQGDLM